MYIDHGSNDAADDSNNKPDIVNDKAEFITSEELQIDQSEAEVLKEHDECPSCYEGEHRWIYECGECSFVGCYDEVYENGCYLGSPDARQCPECCSTERTRIGKVGKGSVEEYDW